PQSHKAKRYSLKKESDPALGLADQDRFVDREANTLQQDDRIVLAARRGLRWRFYELRIFAKFSGRPARGTKIAIVAGAFFSILTVITFKRLAGFHQRI